MLPPGSKYTPRPPPAIPTRRYLAIRTRRGSAGAPWSLEILTQGLKRRGFVMRRLRKPAAHGMKTAQIETLRSQTTWRSHSQEAITWKRCREQNRRGYRKGESSNRPDQENAQQSKSISGLSPWALLSVDLPHDGGLLIEHLGTGHIGNLSRVPTYESTNQGTELGLKGVRVGGPWRGPFWGSPIRSLGSPGAYR